MADLRICCNNFCARNIFFRKEGYDVASSAPKTDNSVVLAVKSASIEPGGREVLKLVTVAGEEAGWADK